jgi:hypothetical protein
VLRVATACSVFGPVTFDFLCRSEGLLLIDADQLPRLEILRTHFIEDAPVVQDVPLEGRPDLASNALGREELAQVLRLVADRAVDEEGRVPVGLGDADLCVLSGDEPLGRA